MKEELGRTRFDVRVEAWYASVGATIMEQFKELGASLDFSRLRFTMDPGYVRAVRTAFVHFWEKGWLYRGREPKGTIIHIHGGPTWLAEDRVNALVQQSLDQNLGAARQALAHSD